MIPLALAGKGVAALGVFKKHWGKIIAALFVAAWVWVTHGLYEDNKELSKLLGESNSATELCINQRKNMDNELILLKADIARIQADNDQYKKDLAEADIVIENLQEGIPVIITEIDNEVIGDTCEESMDWMLEKALNK